MPQINDIFYTYHTCCDVMYYQYEKNLQQLRQDQSFVFLQGINQAEIFRM